jgi:tubulin gamma
MWIVFQYNLKLLQDNDLSEFDESRDIIESLVDEYKACESPDYIKWGMEVFSC